MEGADGNEKTRGKEDGAEQIGVGEGDAAGTESLTESESGSRSGLKSKLSPTKIHQGDSDDVVAT